MENTRYLTKLKGARVLIIGGTSGIGFGIAEALVQHNAHVFLASSTIQRVTTAVQTLQGKYPSSHDSIAGFPCDLSSQETIGLEVETLLKQVTETGLLDHVIFTAGDAFALGPLEDFTLEKMQQAGMVRFFGPLVVAQQLSKVMVSSTTSSFTITTGGLTQRPRKGWVVMMSYLVGLEGMTRALAKDLAPIRVNLVGPGPTDTQRWSSHQETADVAALKRGLADATVTKQIGKVEDVVESYLYLMKDRNTTGAIVYTNGGALLV